jgi:hypothetical protein
MGFDSEN